MSSFLLSQETFNNIYRTLQFAATTRHFQKECCEYYHLGNIIAKHNLATVEPDEAAPQMRKWVEKMYRYNLMAVSERYSEPTSDDDVAWHLAGIKPGRKLTLVELVKALQCLDYQCIDSSDYWSDYHETVDRFTAEIAELAIGYLPEYKAAQWG